MGIATGAGATAGSGDLLPNGLRSQPNADEGAGAGAGSTGTAGGPGYGPSIARNTGIDAATGDLITFCDDDD
ncbi:MAG: glycosyltransferase, partial [Acidovorax sp.]